MDNYNIKKKVKKIVSLGFSCQTVLGLQDLFDHQARLPFDFSTVSHYTLNFLLKNNFKTILNPSSKVELEESFRLNFYNHANGFYFGHQKLDNVKDIHNKIKRRCRRFLDLRKEEGCCLFVRQREINWDNDRWSENVYKENLLDEILQEYNEIKASIIEFGIKDFEFLYVISSPIQTLDGFVTIQEGQITENIYSIDFIGPVDQNNWGKIRTLIEEKYDFS